MPILTAKLSFRNHLHDKWMDIHHAFTSVIFHEQKDGTMPMLALKLFLIYQL